MARPTLVSVPILALLVNAVCLQGLAIAEPVTVSTPVGDIKGTSVHMVVDGQNNLMSKFLGIPYGETTAGSNRFRKPIPKANFTTVYDATYVRQTCPQTPTPGDNTVYSEDCLFLNVYVPGNVTSQSGLAVMIWIHGGSFVQGSSYQYQMDVLSSYGNVIVVTINYRLGRFGFLTTGDGRLGGNYGLWDQHLAIKWVHGNIAAFGGNKEEVTLFGESAGSSCIFYQALYPQNKGLIKRVIGESGAAIAYWAFQATSNAEATLNQTNCATAVDQVDCLRTKSTADIQNVKEANTYMLRPSVDGDFLSEPPRDILMKSNNVSDSARSFFASLDIITGVNNMDGALWLTAVWAPYLGVKDLDHLQINQTQLKESLIPSGIDFIYSSVKPLTKSALSDAVGFRYTDWNDLHNMAAVRQNLVTFSSDIAFFVPAVDTISAHARLCGGRKASYFYEFAATPSRHTLYTPSWLLGANHADEIPFVEGVIVSLNFPSDEVLLSKAMMAAWSNFAKSGNPNMPMDVTSLLNTTWPQYDLTSQKYIQLSTAMSSASVKERFAAESVAFWTELVPSILKSTCTGHSPMATNEPDPMLIG